MNASATPTRNTDRTRRRILDAAIDLVGERGSSVSIAQVAVAAGVSKSGLLHHFSSREGLFAAVAEDTVSRFRQDVIAHVDLSENRAGKLLRAYVRALCGGSAEAMAAFSSSTVWHWLAQEPAVIAVVAADNAWWSTELLADGIGAERMTVVRRAAEGVAVAYGHDEETAEAVEQARSVLLALAEPDGQFAVTPRG
ncbi:MAG: TetR/AcrR family transcriptional regulator [Mycetocola sp.]